MRSLWRGYLAGAVALMLAGGVAACNRAAEDPVPQETGAAPAAVEPQRNDGWVTTSVQARYYTDDQLRGRNIDVSTENGVVTLSGTVRDEAAKTRAVEIARQVEGVSNVNDQLRVGTQQAANPQAEAGRGPAERDEAAGTTGKVGDRIEAGWITAKINAQYFADTNLSGFNIDVDTTSNGIVTLSGRVETEQQKAEALRIARETEGVVRVNDELRVRPAEAAGAAGGEAMDASIDRPDAWLTTKVQSKYFLDPDVKGRDIDVETRNAVVTLTGTVGSEAERRQAVALARNTDGVKEVTDQLQVRADAPAPDRDEDVRPVRSLDQAAADTRITTMIQSKYFLDSEVKGHQINVDTRGGVVTLTGQAGSDAIKQEAERIARETDGVTRVVNQVKVNAG